METLFTALQPAEYQEVIQRSRFVGNIIPVSSLDMARETIATIQSRYRDSSHNCWAYAVGLQNVMYHSSDAGEPSGTAGKPIEGVIRKQNLTNVVITVSRYFGGVQLGIRGLIDAYTHIAEETVKKTKLQKSVMKDFYSIQLAYRRLEKLKGYIREKDAEILDIHYGKEIALTLCIRNTYNFKEYLAAETTTGELSYEFIKSDVFF